MFGLDAYLILSGVVKASFGSRSNTIIIESKHLATLQVQSKKKEVYIYIYIYKFIYVMNTVVKDGNWRRLT